MAKGDTPSGGEVPEKSLPIKTISVQVLWVQPVNGLILVRHENESRLMPHTFWLGERVLDIREDDFKSFDKPDLSGVIAKAGLTADDLATLFARTGITSLETVTPSAVAQAVQLIANAVASGLK